MNTKWGTGLTIAALAIACGGKGKPPAMTADTPSSDSDAGGTDWSGYGSDGGGGTTGTSETADAAGGGSTPASTETAAAGGSEESARTLLKQFVDPKADHVSLSKSLRPTSADYKSMFDSQTAAKVEAAHAKDWDGGKMVIKPKDAKQSEIKIWGATGAELASGGGNASQFPGGYKKIGQHLAPTVTFYAFKFVQPGKETGMAFDGLAFVNGHWVIAPKPWHGLGDGGGRAAPVSGGGNGHRKPHPKKK